MKYPTAINTTMSTSQWLMLIFLSLLWGGSFFFVGVLVKTLPPLTIVTARVGLAALLLYVIIKFSGKAITHNKTILAAFFVMGLLNNVIPYILIVWGQKQIPAGLAAILNAATPLFGVVVAHFWARDEKITPPKILGLFLGFAGVVVLVGPSAVSHNNTSFWAELAILAAAVSYAFASVYGRRFKTMGVSPPQTAMGQLTASSIILLPLALIFDHPWQLSSLTPATWSALAGLVILSTALAYIIYFRILASSGAVNIMLVTLLIPPSAILLSWLFLGEQLEPRQYVGMGLILAGLIAIDGRIFKRKPQRA